MKEEYTDCCFCVICGAPIPEGRLVCPNCEVAYRGDENSDDDDLYNDLIDTIIYK